MSTRFGSHREYEWARHRSRGELLDLVLEIEDRLRRVVRSVLQDAADGAGWEPLIAVSIRAVIEKTKARSTHQDLLDRATLHQLFSVVLNRWDLFAALFGDRSQFHDEADRFLGWRNQLAHGKQPTEPEKLELASTVGRMGRHLAAPVDPTSLPDSSVFGSSILWVDDQPEQNLRERRVLRMLGIEVIPVQGNDEAIAAASDRPFDLVISDVDRTGAERGDQLPVRLDKIGVGAPVIFYVGEVRRELGTPHGAYAIHDDPAALVRDALILLSKARV